MLTAAQLLADFERMYREHWRYEWGAADRGCVDCSGAFVYAYRLHMQSITHGSNAIARNHCGPLLNIAGAIPGMAAFKARVPGQSGYALPAKYRTSGDLRDFYHIGLVDGTGQYVLNAKSTSAGFSRDPISKWACVARLNAVDYGGEVLPMEPMIVTCNPGETVRLRQSASTQAATLVKIPNATRVEAGPDTDGWRAVDYAGKKGYMIAKFLEPAPAETPAGDTGDTVTVTLPRGYAEQLRDALIEAVGMG